MDKSVSERDVTGIFELVKVLEAALATSSCVSLKGLSATLEAYSEDFPDEYIWATGAQAPMLLH